MPIEVNNFIADAENADAKEHTTSQYLYHQADQAFASMVLAQAKRQIFLLCVNKNRSFCDWPFT